ncbi:MAG TPA: cyclic nucleotide-binding domain-containing protein [Anaeromyxobacteraceae bacterium]|nr:cyclic nucleotide-binding domain-containing protein [Anaeromyxobacteraceae bacterium]
MTLEVALVRREQLPELFRFRHGVFFEELRALLPEEEIERGYMTDPLDESAFNYVLLDGGEIVGSLRFVDFERVAARGDLERKYRLGPIVERFGASGIAIIGRLALAPRCRSGVALSRLISRGYEDARSRGIRVGVSDCSPYLLPFEERLGYRRYAPPFGDPVYGLKLPILLLGEGNAHLQTIRSPLARAAARFEADESVEEWFRATYPEFASVPGLAPSSLAESLGELGRREASGFLAGLEAQEVRTLLDGAVPLTVPAGNFLIRKGMREDHIYLILEGTAEAVGAEHKVLHRFGAGDVVGEMAFLTNSTRSCDVIVREPTRCVLVHPHSIRRCAGRSPELYGKVMQNLARTVAIRLRAA